MAELKDFILENLWLCIGFGLIAVVIGDEFLGVSRNLLGDDVDEEPFTAENRETAPPEDPIDPLDAREKEEGGYRIEEMLGRRRRDQPSGDE